MTTLEPDTSALIILARKASGQEDHSDNDVRTWNFPNPQDARNALEAAVEAIKKVWIERVEKK